MATTLNVQVKVGELSKQGLTDLLTEGTDAVHVGVALARYIRSLAGGVRSGRIYLQVDDANPVKASVTATCDTVIATNTLTVGTVTLTADATPANENEFDPGASDTECAANIAAAINDHSVLGLAVSATSAAGVVTITAHVAGELGNHIAVSENSTTITLSAATLTGGTGFSSAPTAYNLGTAA
jgi:phage tail sheath gpL-like